ncbi:MAG: ribonuclease E/G, partial [Chloroflexota bacterium]
MLALHPTGPAAEEIARQLRIRDLGGLIVIDFIDMESKMNQQSVEDRLRDAVRSDRARIQLGRISRFGLMEMSRQRLRPSLGESTHTVCPRCSGMGTIRSVESMALAVLRLIGEEVRKDRTTRVIAQLPVDVATFLINEKREWLNQLESRSTTDIVLVPDKNMETPNYSIRRVRDDELALPENALTSYQFAGQPPVEIDFKTEAEKRPAPAAPAVQAIAPAAPVPAPAAPASLRVAGPGFWERLTAWFRQRGERRPQAASEAATGAPRRPETRDGRGGQDRGGGQRRERHENRYRSDHRRDRDRNADRNRNRDRDRDRNRAQGGEPRGDRPAHAQPRHENDRPRDKTADAPAQAPPNVPRQTEQTPAEGEPRRRRRRRRGRGGHREGRPEFQGPADSTSPRENPPEGTTPASEQLPSSPRQQEVPQQTPVPPDFRDTAP